MKKWFFPGIAMILLLFACKKKSDDTCSYTESSTVATATEVNFLDSFFTANGIVPVKLASGVSYTLDSAGTGIKAVGLCANLTVTYKGFLLGNSAAFDSSTIAAGTTLQLGALVVGWQKVLPEVKAGSKVTLYIPPSLAYGAAVKKNGDGDVIIPPDSYLKFTIDLIKVQ